MREMNHRELPGPDEPEVPNLPTEPDEPGTEQSLDIEKLKQSKAAIRRMLKEQEAIGITEADGNEDPGSELDTVFNKV